MVTPFWLLVIFPSSQKRRSTPSLETAPRLRSVTRGIHLHRAQYGLECFLAPKRGKSTRNGSRTRALATPRAVSPLVFCSGYRLELLRKGNGPSLNGGLVGIDVRCVSNDLHASVRLGPESIAGTAYGGRC